MKKSIVLLLYLLLLPFLCESQPLENLDYISPFHEGLAAVNKDGKWAFIDTKGKIIINFRNDLAVSEYNHEDYPLFSDKRCLIEKRKDGISYFGYINTSGKTVIEPKYLNATNFNNGNAIVIRLIKETVGRNIALGKNVAYDKYFEVTIDTDGNISNYLSEKPKNIILDKDYTKEPPKICSRYLSETLYAVQHENNTWEIINLKDKN